MGLLAALAFRAGEWVPEDALINAVWGGTPPATAADRLRRYAHEWQKALASHDIWIEPGYGYTLDIDPAHVDVLIFRALAEAAHDNLDRTDRRDSAGQQAARADLDDALGLWGETKPPAALSWLPSQALRREWDPCLETLWLQARHDRILTYMNQERPESVTAELADLTRDYPLREEFWMWRMVAEYYASFHSASAIRYQTALNTYDEACEAMRKLGTPGPEQHYVHQQILDFKVPLHRL